MKQKEVAMSHIPIPEGLGPRNDFGRLGFVIRWTPTNLSKFLPYHQRLFAGHGSYPVWTGGGSGGVD